MARNAQAGGRGPTGTTLNPSVDGYRENGLESNGISRSNGVGFGHGSAGLSKTKPAPSRRAGQPRRANVSMTSFAVGRAVGSSARHLRQGCKGALHMRPERAAGGTLWCTLCTLWAWAADTEQRTQKQHLLAGAAAPALRSPARAQPRMSART